MTCTLEGESSVKVEESERECREVRGEFQVGEVVEDEAPHGFSICIPQEAGADLP